MRRYSISDYLTDEQKRLALAHTYHRLRSSSPRDDAGYCPLGRAIEEPNTPGMRARRAPLAPEVGVALDGQMYGPARYDAELFIVNWDSGEITDLAAALGVTDAAAPR